jgi:hypothetical protein
MYASIIGSLVKGVRVPLKLSVPLSVREEPPLKKVSGASPESNDPGCLSAGERESLGSKIMDAVTNLNGF